ncbi:MAG: class I SAM-dependent methyltransferase [Gammaproteobacteria bacterium]|nr:class I SAM-dependent methyltransferase [Gammaproteobacteria bacterium]
MSNQTLNLTPHLYQYILSNTREPEILSALRHETAQMTGSEMIISPEQGQLMGLLLELLNARKTLDIGTFTGYSALIAALALPSDGQVVTCDVSPEATTVALRYFEKAGMTDKISLRLGSALSTLDQLLTDDEASTFDFIFIDADKKNYDEYYEQSLRLLRRGGLIAIDNVLWGGKVAASVENDEITQTMRTLNKKILRDTRVTHNLVPIGDGLSLVRKR